MLLNKSKNRVERMATILAVALVSGVLLLSIAGFVRAEVETLSVSVDMTSSGNPVAGGTIQYTIFVSTTGTGLASFQITNTLPASLTYVADSLTANPSEIVVSEGGGVISSTARGLNTGETATISYRAKIDENAILDDVIANTVLIGGDEVLDSTTYSDSSTASITIIEQTDPIDLFVSKSASKDEATPGGVINYTILVTTSANSLRPFVLTDTLPSGVTFVDGSIDSSSGLVVSENNGVIASTVSGLNPGDTAQTSFRVTIDESTPISTVITNTVVMHDMQNDILLASSAGTTVVTVTNRIAYLPFVAKELDTPTNNAITEPTGSTNDWNVTWENKHASDSRITGYEVQESTDPSFPESATTTTAVGKVTTLAVTKPVESQVEYYYRVRSVASGIFNSKSLWSATQSVTSIYFFDEQFNDDSNPGNWKIVRQDTDTIINKISVHDGYLDLRMESRFDYMIASNLNRVPENDNFRVTARMRLEDADPRHAGGIIIGGDYDGTSACPESIDEDNPENSKYSTCFTEYYRFMFIAGNISNQFTTQIKRIEEHSESNNSGSGTDLAGKTLISDKGRKSWIEWSIEVYQDGTMKMFLEDELIHEVNDTTYRDNKYFGFWSSTADTTFSNTQIDWVTVEVINP